MGNTLQKEKLQEQAQDVTNRTKIEAKSGLKNYCSTMHNPPRKEKSRDSFEDRNKEIAVQETLDRLTKNQLAVKNEFEGKTKCVAENGLENYCGEMRNTLQKDKKGKHEDENGACHEHDH